MFSAPKLVLVCAVLFFVVALPAMAALIVVFGRSKES